MYKNANQKKFLKKMLYKQLREVENLSVILTVFSTKWAHVNFIFNLK